MIKIEPMDYLENTQTTISTELVLNFFLVLSRMEFALKFAGFASGDEKSVTPDWDDFASKIQDKFNSQNNEKLSNAMEYYLDYPPQKQVLINDKLDWVDAIPQKNSEIERALILVRRVRNNLFHGGKYNQQEHKETARNEQLLTQGMIILKEAMSLNTKVQRAYEGAAI
jgi:hypothetical protein